MGAHIEHPKSYTHGLCDDCPECVSRIESPLKLDAINLQRIWRGDHKTRTDVKVYDAIYRAVIVRDGLARALELEQPHYTSPESVWAHGGKA